jgi:hypothetical protein
MRTDRFAGMPAIPVESLEDQLKQSLRPVKPDQDFVDHLHTRLKTPSTMILERRQNAAMGLLLVSSSLFIGIILVWLLRQWRHIFA